MKPIILTVICLALGLSLAVAHPDHTILELDDAVSEAKFNVVQLIENKTLSASWQDIQPDMDKSGVETLHGKRRWVFIYENPQEKDSTKKIVKIFMTPLGKFISYEFLQP